MKQDELDAARRRVNELTAERDKLRKENDLLHVRMGPAQGRTGGGP